MGIRGAVARSTLADANEARDWRIYADFAQVLIRIARRLYVDEPFGVDLKDTVYALDSTTIDLCLSVFPWAPFRSTKAAIKLHTLLDLRGNIPSFIHITDGKTARGQRPRPVAARAGRVLRDGSRLSRFRALAIASPSGQAFFVTRAKRNTNSSAATRTRWIEPPDSVAIRRSPSRCSTRSGLSRAACAASRSRPTKRAKRLVFLTNNFALPALTIAELYRCRWQVELFFKWIKQHLRIKAFFGTSENAVKTQIWIAISVYVLVAIVKKRLALDASLYEILQILSLTMFETTCARTCEARSYLKLGFLETRRRPSPPVVPV